MSTTAPQPQYTPAPPPKQKHTLRNVLLVILVLIVLFVGGCLALVGGAINSADKAVKQEEKNDAPTAVIAGKPFTHDKFKVHKGWRVAHDFGGATIKNIHVTNVSKEDKRTALLTFRFYKGSNVLAEVECSTNEMQSGESSDMDCVSTSSKFPKGYKTIKVADAF